MELFMATVEFVLIYFTCVLVIYGSLTFVQILYNEFQFKHLTRQLDEIKAYNNAVEYSLIVHDMYQFKKLLSMGSREYAIHKANGGEL